MAPDSDPVLRQGSGAWECFLVFGGFRTSLAMEKKHPTAVADKPGQDRKEILNCSLGEGVTRRGPSEGLDGWFTAQNRPPPQSPQGVDGEASRGWAGAGQAGQDSRPQRIWSRCPSRFAGSPPPGLGCRGTPHP